MRFTTERNNRATPRSLQIITAYLLLVTAASWYTLLIEGFENIWIDSISIVITTIITIGIYIRTNIARLALMALSALISVISAGFILLSIVIQFISIIEFGFSMMLPSVVFGIYLLLILIHLPIYSTLRKESIRGYFVLHST